MPDVIISYKDSQIASMDASGTKTLLTEGKYCEDDITIQYAKYSPEVYAGEHHQPTPSGYTVTVSLTNPRNSSYFENWTISESPTDLTDWTQIGTITSATGSETVTVTERYILVATTASNSAGGVYSAPAEILYIGSGEYPQTFMFEVTGDGTITIDDVNYDD